MIEDLLKMRAHIDTMIETYKDLHPDDDSEYIAHKDEIIIQEELEKETALTRVRENYYEDKFSKGKGEKTTRSSKGQTDLCVYGDT